MNDDELQRLIQQLDAQIPAEGAFVQFRLLGTEYGLSANRQGYLRLAVEMLLAAYLPTERLPEVDVQMVPVDIDYLQHKDVRGDLWIAWFERTEQPHSDPEVEETGSVSNGSKLVAALLVFLAVIFCIGLFDVAQWLVELVRSLF